MSDHQLFGAVVATVLVVVVTMQVRDWTGGGGDVTLCDGDGMKGATCGVGRRGSCPVLSFVRRSVLMPGA